MGPSDGNIGSKLGCIGGHPVAQDNTEAILDFKASP